MLSCKETTRLLSSEDKVSFLKKAELGMHLLMCRYCSRYAKHLQILADGFKKFIRAKTHLDAAQVELIEKEVIERVERRGGQ